MFSGLGFGLSHIRRGRHVCGILRLASFSRPLVSLSTNLSNGCPAVTAAPVDSLQHNFPSTFKWSGCGNSQDSPVWKYPGQKYSPWSLTQTRTHWRIRRSQRAPPTKPLHFDYSGDLDMSIGQVDMTSPKPGFEDVPELLEADENIKKIFSLEYATHADVIKKHVDQLLEKVKDHPLDIRSLEVKIAKQTIDIRSGIQHCLRFRKVDYNPSNLRVFDKVSKANLIELIHKRKSYLRRLMTQDIDKFNWLQRELRIKFVEDTREKKPSKADRRKKAAEDAMNAVFEAKIAALRKAMEEERVKFEKYKEAELADIERGMRALGLPADSLTSLENALTALGHPELVPRPAPQLSLSRATLARQMELYGPRKKVQDAEILHAHGFLTPDELTHYPEGKD